MNAMSIWTASRTQTKQTTSVVYRCAFDVGLKGESLGEPCSYRGK